MPSELTSTGWRIPTLLVACGLQVVSHGEGHAQINVDGTLGPARSLQGPAYTIGADLGLQRGPNLFHSFGQFNIGAGESATFTGPLSVRNILSRVTGGQRSLIDGPLRSTIPGASFFLLNPSGVVFGPGASLDVSGSFHVSSADYLRFADGARLHADPVRGSSLGVAAPEAFGFLGPSPGPIQILGSTLRVPPGQTLSAVGGEVTVRGPSLSAGDGRTRFAPGGRIHLAGVASAGEVTIRDGSGNPTLTAGGFDRLGRVTVTHGAVIETSGDGAGTVAIRAGSVTLDQSAIFSDTLGNAASAPVGVDIQATEAVAVTGGAAITADALGSRRPGNVEIRAPLVEVRDGALVGSRSFAGSTAEASRVVIVADTVRVDSSTLQVSSEGAARAGSVEIFAGSTTVSASRIDASGPGNGSIVVGGGALRLDRSEVFADATGNQEGARFGVDIQLRDDLVLSQTLVTADVFGRQRGGDLSVQAGGVHLTGASALLSQLLPGSTGDGGSLTVSSRGSVAMSEGSTIGTFSLGAGSAGPVSVTGETVSVAGGSRIGSTAFGPSTAGAVAVRGASSVEVVGRVPGGQQSALFSRGRQLGGGGTLRVQTPLLFLDDSLISADTDSQRPAGAIDIDVGRMLVTGGAQVLVGSFVPPFGGGGGAAGTVTIRAEESILVSGRDGDPFVSGFFSSTQSGGAGGRIVVSAPRLELRGTAALRAESDGAGPAGEIQLDVGRLIVADGASIDTNSTAGGAVGTVLLRGGRVELLDGGQILSSSGGPGAGGRMVITADSLLASGRASGLRADASSAGRGGTIEVAARTVDLEREAEITTSSSGSGAAGSATLRASEAIRLSGGAQISALAEGTGDGGRIEILAPRLEIRGGSLQSTSTNRARAGDIEVRVDRLLLGADATIDSSALGSGAAGNLTVAARESIVMTPGSAITSGSLGSSPGGLLSVTTPRLTMNGGLISTLSGGTGPAGKVLVTVDGLALQAGADINSDTVGPGAAGDVVVVAREAARITGLDPGTGVPSSIGSSTLASVGAGQGGRVAITTPVLEVSKDGAILSQAPGDGAAGDITIEAGRILLQDGGRIDSSSRGRGAGTVTLNAADSIVLSGRGLAPSSITSNTAGAGNGGRLAITTGSLTMHDGRIQATTSGAGRAGDVDVVADRLRLTGGGQISTSTFGRGDAGTVNVTASTAIEVAGTDGGGAFSGIFASAGLCVFGPCGPPDIGGGGRVSVSSPRLEMNDGRIQTLTAGRGDAGDIRMGVDHVLLQEGARIEASTLGSGRGGTIAIHAPGSVDLNTGAAIVARTVSGGAAGSISLQAGSVSLASGARIDSGTSASGEGGTIAVRTSSLGLKAGHIASNAQGSGRGGDVDLAVGVLALEDGAQISATSAERGNAGSIRIVSDRFSARASSVATSTLGADGGNVGIEAVTLLVLRDSTVTATVQGGQGQGGNIAITSSGSVILDGTQIRADAFGGPGGNVIIGSSTYLSRNSIVSASSAMGLPGSIDVNARITDIGGTLVTLPEAVLQAAVLLRRSCVVRGSEGIQSSLAVRGAGGLAPEPGTMRSAPITGFETTAWLPSRAAENRAIYLVPVTVTISCPRLS